MNATNRTPGASIDIRKASKRYGKFVALRDLDLSIRPGEFMTLLGPSGSGKTTTLNLIAGFTEVSSGTLEIGGKSVLGLPSHKRNIGVVFQHYALFPHMSVGRNVAYPLTLRGISGAEREGKVRHALDMVKMADFAHRYPNELSGGQQQRVAIARAIVTNPALVLADEPTGNLDSRSTEDVLGIFKHLNDTGRTVVMITHEDDVAAHAERLVHLADGRIVRDKALR